LGKIGEQEGKKEGERGGGGRSGVKAGMQTVQSVKDILEADC
jgi:hypothetical protein